MKEGLKSVSISTDNVSFTPLCTTDEISLSVDLEEDNGIFEFLESIKPKDNSYYMRDELGRTFKAKVKNEFTTTKIKKGKRYIRKVKYTGNVLMEGTLVC